MDKRNRNPVMVKIIASLSLCFLTLLALGQAFTLSDTAWLGQRVAIPAGGGPDAWYDIEVSANRDTLAAYVPASEYVSAVVTVSQAGTATKARVFSNNFGGTTQNIKMALYASGGGAPIASGTVSILSTDDDVYKEITFDTPVAVTATTYILAWCADSANVGWYHNAGVGATDIYTGVGYSGFPENPLDTPTFPDLSRNACVSLYVD